MHNYSLSKEAEADIREIIQYTAKRWGKKQAQKYINELEITFVKISEGTLLGRHFSTKFPNVSFVTSGKHFVFYLNTKSTPIIIAIIHRARNIVKHLAKRHSN